MAKKALNLMLVPDGAHAKVHRLRIPIGVVYGGALVTIAAVAALLSLLVHYGYVVNQVFEARATREENDRLRGRIALLQGKVDEVDRRLAQLKTFDEKLRQMTDLHDDERGLAMGPLRASPQTGGSAAADVDPFAVPVDGSDPATEQLREALVDSRLASLAHEANRELESLSDLADYFSVREALLKSAPSIAPARGLLTSGFGSREDPFTGEHTMHSGLDIATREGAEVVAPADGVIVFAGEMSSYGNCIRIEHGRDVSTLFGHLKDVLVKAGDRVQRGQHIGNVGNTGRSTGPHLHYEVRKDNIPTNPRKYIVH